MQVIGSKAGAKSPRQPFIQRDSLRSIAYFKGLYAIGEGEIEGLADGLKSVKLNDTPLMSENGTMNYKDISFEFRNGTVEQEYITGFPDVSNEIGINVELKSSTPWVKAISNTELNAIRIRLSWPAISNALPTGDIIGYRIGYVIELSTDGGTYQEVISTAVNGKTTSGYQRTHRIDLPESSNGWQIRVRRTTPNQNNNFIQDRMMIDAITEVIDAKLRYPNTALGAIQFDFEQFSNVPKVSFIVKGKIIKVPSNYNAVDRTYIGVWDGTFKLSYTNNPAWVWYDIVLNPRYGLGNRIDASMVNKWEIYRIGQYCDEMVSNGSGGLEPRFTCNVCIQQQKEAYTVLSDLASIFHGMSYYDGNKLVAVADMPSDPVYSFGRANIVDGIVNYQGTKRRDRHSIAVCAWDDPKNNFQTKKEPVWIYNSVKTLGIQPLEVGAVGCTSVGQAIRAGKWALETEQRETRIATFKVGLDGSIPKPGDIIKLSDSIIAGRVNSGRIIEATKREITVDQLSVIRIGDNFTVNLPSGKAESRTVQSVNGRVIKLASAYSELPQKQSMWVVDSQDLSTMSFRVVSITKPEQHQYEIIGIQHAPEKYKVIDTGAVIDDKPITVIPPSVQKPPKNVEITQNISVEQGIAVTNMTISWDSAEDAVSYKVEWRRDNLQWVSEPNTGSNSIDIKGIYTGEYLARVYAINAMGAVSLPTSSVLTIIKGKTGAPPVPVFLETKSIIFGIKLSWGFPRDSADTQRTEIEYSKTADGQNPMKLGDYAYPQSSHTMDGLAAGQRFWFRARLVDRTGNVGAWTVWTSGIASNDASDILGLIEGQITESQLGKDLLEKLESGGGAATEIKQIKDDLAAMITLKTQLTVDGKEYLAGIGVGVENHEGITQSQVLIAADRFAIIHPNGESVIVPFVIENGKVYIESTFIKDGTIDMAKIGSYLQSDDFVSGKQGWRISKDGTFEVNGNEAGGKRIDSATKTLIYYPNGQLAVALGVDI